MRQRWVSFLLLVLLPIVGAIALPVQAALTKVEAQLLAEAQSSNKDTPGSETQDEPKPAGGLFATRVWTVEKCSRQLSPGDREEPVIAEGAWTPLAASPWRLSRLNAQLILHPRVHLVPAVHYHLIGAHAPPSGN